MKKFHGKAKRFLLPFQFIGKVFITIMVIGIYHYYDVTGKIL